MPGNNNSLWIAAVASLLSACAPLTADAPLFSPADQIGPAPLVEGVWIGIGEHCPRRNMRRRGRLPKECAPAELRRQPDGTWIYRYQDHVPMSEGPDQTSMPRSWRLVIAPATERQPSDAFVPLYVVEYEPIDETEWKSGPHYAALVPIGPMPAREFSLAFEIDCKEILRDGPIAGIIEERGPQPEGTEAAEVGTTPPSAPEPGESQSQATEDDGRDIVRCVASTKPAVREAVRRATIENLSEMLGDGGARLVFVRP